MRLRTSKKLGRRFFVVFRPAVLVRLQTYLEPSRTFDGAL